MCLSVKYAPNSLIADSSLPIKYSYTLPLRSTSYNSSETSFKFNGILSICLII